MSLSKLMGQFNVQLGGVQSGRGAFFEMQPTVVDDVQVSCYYQKVPRVKSGLPVYGGLIGWAVCTGIRLRENLG